MFSGKKGRALHIIFGCFGIVMASGAADTFTGRGVLLVGTTGREIIDGKDHPCWYRDKFA